MTSRLKKIITIGIICLVLAAGLGIYANKWTGEKMQKVVLGLAEPIFPYRDYTEDELAKMYPQIKYADVLTRVTPEQTYTNFREALRTNNLDLALEQLSKESIKYSENIDELKKAYETNKFVEGLKYYPEKIWRSNFGQSIGNLCYEQERDNGKFVGCTAFIKDANGDWKLDSL